MKHHTRQIGRLTTQLIAIVLIAICFAIGAVGLILPIIPGLLFLAIALMLTAKWFPSIDRKLRRNRTIRSYLESAEGFSALTWLKKLQYGLLLTLRVFVDAVAFFVYVIAKLLSLAVVRYQAGR